MDLKLKYRKTIDFAVLYTCIWSHVQVSLELRNPLTTFIFPRISVVDSPHVQINPAWSDAHGLAPSQSAHVTVALMVIFHAQCLQPFRLLVALQDNASTSEEYVHTETVTVELRCRHRGQSILATFVDGDASLQRVAVVHPPASACGNGTTLSGVSCPILLTLHGTGISASDSADAFKVMHQGDSEYTFGFGQVRVQATPSCSQGILRHGCAAVVVCGLCLWSCTKTRSATQSTISWVSCVSSWQGWYNGGVRVGVCVCVGGGIQRCIHVWVRRGNTGVVVGA